MGSAFVLIALIVVQQADAPAEQAVREFNETFFKKENAESDRVAAVRKLEDVPDAETSKVLAKLLLWPEEAVSVEAAQVLAKFTDVKGVAARVVPCFSDRTNLKRSAVRVEIVKCLGALRDPAGLLALQRTLRDRDLYVAREVVVQLKGWRQKSSVPLLIDYLKVCEKAPSGNIEVPVVLKRYTDKRVPQDKTQPSQMTVFVTMDADQFARMRKELLHRPLLDALRGITRQRWESYKGWHEWWTAEGAAFTVPEE
ncbi:MAG: HEAT repeat domain-containing protein [Planctomycetes bacterium]|nr:HEAT repeat domain-containing protein [Planctomycetota bacterium]